MSVAPYATIPDLSTIDRTAAALRSRAIETTIVEDRSSALDALISLVPTGTSIYCSPSATLAEIGFRDYVRRSERYIDLHISMRDDPSITKKETMYKRLEAQYTVGSVNALTEAGELVFASHSGSQLGPYAFSADNVIWVVGAQKICATLPDAMRRVREYSHALEDQRIGLPQGHSSQIGKWLIIENDLPGRCAMILVREALGF